MTGEVRFILKVEGQASRVDRDFKSFSKIPRSSQQEFASKSKIIQDGG